MRNDKDSNHPGYDAVRTDILVPTFQSCLLLPPSGWYTLTKLVAATSETLLPMHQNTYHHIPDNWTIHHFVPNFSRQLSLIIKIRC